MISRFENRTPDKRIDEAVKKADELLSNDSLMMFDLLHNDDFKYNSGKGIDVYRKINYCEAVAPIYFFKSFNPFTKSVGYSDGKAIYLNTRKIASLELNELVGLLIHEWLHFGPKFGHGNNWKDYDKINFSVNYFCSEGISQGKWL